MNNNNLDILKKIALYSSLGGAASFVLYHVAQHTVCNYILDKVTPLPGSVLFVGMALSTNAHSGIYVGDGRIVELSGTGYINNVSFHEFMQVPVAVRTGLTIYTLCSKEGPIESKEVAERALSEVNKNWGYNVLTNNCHMFTTGCLTGNFKNNCNLLARVMTTAKKLYNADSARAVEYDLAVETNHPNNINVSNLS